MTRLRLIVLAALAMPALAACGPTAEQRCTGAKDLVTCTALVAPGRGSTDALLAGAAGAAIGATLAGGRSNPTTIVAAPVAPTYAGRFHDRAQRSRTVTTTRRGIFGTRTVTRTTTTSSRPSYSSSFRHRR